MHLAILVCEKHFVSMGFNWSSKTEWRRIKILIVCLCNQIGPKHFLLYIFWQKQPPVYPSPHRLEFQMKALELSHQAVGQRMTSLDKDLNIILMLTRESREEKKYLKVGSY